MSGSGTYLVFRNEKVGEGEAIGNATGERGNLRSHDALTGLPDRATLEEDLARIIRELPSDLVPLATIVLDIDDMRGINDAHGHASGDAILSQLATRLRASAPVGAVVGRLESDSFAILVYHADALKAHEIALAILRALGDPFSTSKGPIELTATIGIAAYPEHGGDPDTLFRHARVALDLARAAGTHVATYAPERDPHDADRRRTVAELRAAIESGDLVVHYQPIVAMSDRRVVAVEALVRWEHATRGLVPPAEFIELAERSGLIRPLTRRVIRTALSDIRSLDLPDLQMSVNISTHDLLDGHLAALVASELQTVGPGPRLRLEVTESALMADAPRAAKVLAELRELGVAIAVDDFGTGYSSLAYLELLPVDEIKIDHSFVRAMHRSASSAAIVRATLQMAGALGLKTVGEGVEDEATWGALHDLGCEFAQGYHIARPMPIDQLREWLGKPHN